MSSTLSNLIYHAVFSTKHREPLIGEPIRLRLYGYIGGIIRDKKGCLIEIDGTSDHIHIVARFTPAMPVSDMLKEIKGGSSRWTNLQQETGPRFAWQAGYAAFSVSPSQLEAVRRYVRNQEAHHKKMTFKEELVKLLEKHGIEFDERYLFD